MPQKVDLYDYLRFKKSIPHPSNYPRITNVQATETGLITWDTDVASTSQVLYGVVPYMGFLSDYDATYVTSHSVQLQNLLPDTRYYFKVQSFRFDALSISHLFTFVTSPIASSFVLQSADLTLWAVTLTASGNIETNVTLLGTPITPTFRDSLNAYWALSIDDEGHLVTTSGASPSGAVAGISLLDAGSIARAITIDTTGNLITT